jgi:hypothetical protein
MLDPVHPQGRANIVSDSISHSIGRLSFKATTASAAGEHLYENPQDI